jgi:hypothetical protein
MPSARSWLTWRRFGQRVRWMLDGYPSLCSIVQQLALSEPNASLLIDVVARQKASFIHGHRDVSLKVILLAHAVHLQEHSRVTWLLTS